MATFDPERRRSVNLSDDKGLHLSVPVVRGSVLAFTSSQGHHASEETIQKSLVGNWKREHLFTLKQSRQMY
jgi:hypothetical protein